MYKDVKSLLKIGVVLVVILMPVITEASLATKVKIYCVKGLVTTQLVNGLNNTKCSLKRKLDITEARVVNSSVKVITGEDAFALIEYPNHTFIKLAPNTKIIIERNNIYINSGKTWFRVEHREDGSLIIKTPTAITGGSGDHPMPYTNTFLEKFLPEFIATAEAASTSNIEVNVIVRPDGSSQFNILCGEITLSAINSQSALKASGGQTVFFDKGSSTPKVQVSSSNYKNRWWNNWPTLVPLHPSGNTTSGSDIGGSTSHQGVKDKYVASVTADAYVYAYNYRNWNRSNRGKYDQLVAGWHPTGGESRAYIKFDLSGTNASNVNKAILKLYHFQTSGSNAVKLGVYRVTSPWNEGSDTYHSGRTERTAPPGDISWVQQPSVAPSSVATFNPGTEMRDWTEVDISSVVKRWLAGTPNYGLVIKPVGNLSRNIGASTYHFASRERDPNLDEPKRKNKSPMLILSQGTMTTPVIHGGSSPSTLITHLPFFEDFCHGSSKWELPSNASFRDGYVVWNTGNFNAVKLKTTIPMENIVIEFDGYAETNGINVWLQNNDSKGYTTILGGWYNTQSGSDIGANEENRQLVAGKVWVPKKWQHYKIVRSGDILAAYCEGRLIFKRYFSKYFDGYGNLKFDSWNAVIGIDNIHIYKAKNAHVQTGFKNKYVSKPHHTRQGQWESSWEDRVTNEQITDSSEWTHYPGHRVDRMPETVVGNSVYQKSRPESMK